MSQIVCVGRVSWIPAGTWKDLESEGFERRDIDGTSQLVAHLEHDARPVAAVIVEGGIADPLTVMQAVARVDSTIEILFVEDRDRGANAVVARAVEPFLGPQMREVSPSSGVDVAAEIRAAARRTGARRADAARRAHTARATRDPHVPLLDPSSTDERRHRLSQQFLDSIIEHVPDMIFVKEARELRFVHFNRAGEELLGRARSELHGRNDYDFFPRDEADFFTEKDRQVLAGRAMVEILEEPIQTRHRGTRWLHTRKVPVLDENGEPLYLVGISQDVTTAREARAQLAQLTSELARSNRDLEDFAYIASHDLQEPLRKIRTFGERLEARIAAKLEPDEAHLLERMRDAATRMQSLIDDLLSYSRVGREPDRSISIALGDAVADVVEDLRPRLEESGGRVDVGALPSVFGPESPIRQLFQNLIGNAVKFTRPGQAPLVRVRCESATDGRATVVVEDDGIGFDMALSDRLFMPFQRLVTREAYPGTGMGLAICARIVEQLGGRIEAFGDPNVGARFTVTLPMPPPAPD